MGETSNAIRNHLGGTERNILLSYREIWRRNMIEFRNIVKKYGKQTIIKNFNLTINKGELVVLIGSSGSGKTTLLKMINRLSSNSGGQIFVNDIDIAQQDPIKLRRNIGYVIQQTGLFPHMTVKENIELIPKLAGKNPAEIEQKTNELLKMVGLQDGFINRYPTELSGGQQQRVGVARAFATDSEVILMDEPFSALDPITRADLQEELFNIQKEQQKTIVFVTHDMDEAINLADRICIMRKGEIVQYDTPENILKNPAGPYVEEFVGKGKIWSKPELIVAGDLSIQNPISISPKRTVLQAIKIMSDKKIDSLPIVNREKHLLGHITLSQLKLVTEKNRTIEDVMKPQYITIAEDEPLVQVLEKFDYHQISSLPIIDENGTLTGLITRSSLLSVLSMQFMEEGGSENGTIFSSTIG